MCGNNLSSVTGTELLTFDTATPSDILGKSRLKPDTLNWITSSPIFSYKNH